MGIRAALGLVAILTALTLATGCQGEEQPMDPLNPDFTPTEEQALQGIDQLMALPSAEDAMPTYVALSEEIRSALDAELGPLSWQMDTPGFRVGYGCGGIFQYLPGRAVRVSAYVLDKTLEEDDWLKAVEIVARVSKEHGFTGEIPVANEAGGHLMVFTDSRNGVVDLYSHAALGIDISSGCYLTDETRAQIEKYGVPDPAAWKRRFPGSTLDATPIPSPTQ